MNRENIGKIETEYEYLKATVHALAVAHKAMSNQKELHPEHTVASITLAMQMIEKLL